MPAAGCGILACILHRPQRAYCHAAVMTIVALSAAVALALWSIVLYNLLVRDRARVAAAWSDVEVQLKRRHDLIPKLVETVKQHAGYERGVLERVVERRASALSAQGPGAKGVTEASLGQNLQRLIAVAEGYPELKASRSFLDLQHALSETEESIQYARRYYNGAVNNLNTRVDSFPDVVIARTFGFHAAEYFELDSAVEAQPAPVA
jgi:LemA protein